MEITNKPVLLKPYDNNLGNPTTFPSFSTYGGRNVKKTRGTRRLKNKGTRRNKGTKRVKKRKNKTK